MKLTTRESHVLEQMDFGKTNAQIAETLGIKIGTVKAHKKAIRIKQNTPALEIAEIPEETEPFETTRCPRS